jgi:hypothetical protein
VNLRLRPLILPGIGLLLFALVTFGSFRLNETRSSKKYFYWSSIRLDRDPLNKEKTVAHECQAEDANCTKWEPLSVWIDPGWLAKIEILSAFPAFLCGLALAHLLVGVGISELITFMIAVPTLMFVWYYFLSWIGFRLLARLAGRFRMKF